MRARGGPRGIVRDLTTLLRRPRGNPTTLSSHRDDTAIVLCMLNVRAVLLCSMRLYRVHAAFTPRSLYTARSLRSHGVLVIFSMAV